MTFLARSGALLGKGNQTSTCSGEKTHLLFSQVERGSIVLAWQVPSQRFVRSEEGSDGGGGHGGEGGHGGGTVGIVLLLSPFVVGTGGDDTGRVLEAVPDVAGAVDLDLLNTGVLSGENDGLAWSGSVVGGLGDVEIPVLVVGGLLVSDELTVAQSVEPSVACK